MARHYPRYSRCLHFSARRSDAPVLLAPRDCGPDVVANAMPGPLSRDQLMHKQAGADGKGLVNLNKCPAMNTYVRHLLYFCLRRLDSLTTKWATPI
jgi:hypothetical protein